MNIPYTPEKHSPAQRAYHQPTDLDAAMHHASCMAGGWYRRPVTVGMKIIETPGERPHEVYILFPADSPVPEGYQRVYTVTAHRDEA